MVDTFVRNFIGSNEIDAVDSTLNAFQANSLNMSLSKLTGYDGGGGDYFLDDEKWLKTSTDKIKSSGANGDSSEAKMGVFDLM